MKRLPRPRAVLVIATMVTLVAAPVANAASSVPPADQIHAARAGLAAYIGTNLPQTVQTSTDLPGCPVIELDDLEAVLADQGIDETDSVGDWGTEIEWDEYADFGPEVVGIVCGGDTDGDSHDSAAGLSVGVFAVDLPTEDDVADLYELVGADVLVAEDDELMEGTVTSGCFSDGGDHFCIAAWSFDSFVIGINLWSSERPLVDGSASVVLRDVLADGISHLAHLAVPNAARTGFA